MSDPETIGQRLRAAREAKELTLEEAERATRIRLKFLDALERGDYSGMTAVQVQGFMRNYTRLLGLDYDLLLAEFESPKARGRRKAKESPLPQPAPRPSSTRRPSVGRIFNRLIALALAAALFGVLVVAAIMIIPRLTGSDDDNDGPTSQTIQQTPDETPLDQASAPQPSNTAETTAGPTPDTTTPPTLDSGDTSGPFTPPTLTGEGIVLEVQVVHRVWLRVTADDTVQYEGVAEEGSILHYTATNTVGLRTTDASALMIIINNQALGALGERGELFDQTFSLNTGLWVPNEDSAALMVTLTETPVLSTLTLTSTTSPEPATLTYTPGPTVTQGPTATLSDGISNADLGDSAAANTPTIPASPAVTRAAATVTPRPTTTNAPTLTSTPTNPPPPIPTLTVTPSLTPSLTVTPSPTVSPSPTLTPTITPFLPPRMTRTPSPAPK